MDRSCELVKGSIARGEAVRVNRDDNFVDENMTDNIGAWRRSGALGHKPILCGYTKFELILPKEGEKTEKLSTDYENLSTGYPQVPH